MRHRRITPSSTGTAHQRGRLSGDARRLSDVVVFNVCSADARESLRRRLETGRPVWVERTDGVHLVSALLTPDPDDLAALLRDVESWGAERGLVRLRFELDGRAYALPARAAVAL